MRKISCQERDDLLNQGVWEVYASLTDAHGEFGEPRISTAWGQGNERVEDVRHPFEGQYAPPDRKPREHWYWREEEDAGTD